MGHDNLVLLHYVHQICKEFYDIDFAKICSAVFRHKVADVCVKTALIGFPLEFSKCQHCILNFSNVIQCHPFDSLPDQLPVTIIQPSHHSHVDPHDLASLDHHISRMGICVEKAVVHNLLDKIIYKFAADLIKVIAACEKLFLMVDGNTINVFHNKDAGCGIFSVKNGRFYKCHIFIFPGKFFHVGCFRQEIHLFLGDTPQLFQHKIQIYRFLDAYRGKELHRLFHQSDIPGHDFVDALSLNLYHNFFAGFQDGAVYLGDRG